MRACVDEWGAPLSDSASSSLPQGDGPGLTVAEGRGGAGRWRRRREPLSTALSLSGLSQSGLEKPTHKNVCR